MDNKKGHKLKKRGHQVTVLRFLDAKQKTIAVGLEFRVIAPDEFPIGFTTKLLTLESELSGLAASRYSIRLFEKGATKMMCS